MNKKPGITLTEVPASDPQTFRRYSDEELRRYLTVSPNDERAKDEAVRRYTYGIQIRSSGDHQR